MIPVLRNMTNFLKPLELTGNRSCKSFLRNNAQTWDADEVQSQIARGIAPESVSVDLEINTQKPLHAKWVTHFEIVKNGWQRADITKALRDNIKEDPLEH